jgi:hypothetical protein
MGDGKGRLRAEPFERATAFLGALTANEPGALVEWLAATPLDARWVRWVQAQGLAAYTFHRLQKTGGLGMLPEDGQAFLHADYYQGVGLNVLQRHEVEVVLAALESAGVESILLKGTPLAYTVYDDPLCRFKGDLDAWIQLDQLSEATAALEGAGYRVVRKEERPPELIRLIGGEQQMVSDVPGAGLIELQWPAFRGEWVRHTTQIDHKAIWERRTPVMIEGRMAQMMAPEDMLIHLCLHQAINHQFDKPWLRSLLDVHLVIQHEEPNWEEVAARARSWRVATVTWTVLSLARRLLGTATPDEIMSAFAPSPWRRWAIRRLRLDRALLEMSAGGYPHRRFVIQLLLIDRARDAVNLAWCGLFPGTDWLRARYGASSPVAVWRERLLHPWRLLISARV